MRSLDSQNVYADRSASSQLIFASLWEINFRYLLCEAPKGEFRAKGSGHSFPDLGQDGLQTTSLWN
jgi:hypothetical protein